MPKEAIEQTEYIHDENPGLVKISDQVLAVCAANAAMKVAGVHSLTGGLAESLQESILRKDSLTKGVKVDQSEEGATVDVYIVVAYGEKIPQVAFDVQTKVKAEIENMTDTPVTKVNVHVQGVSAEEKSL